MDTIEYIKNMKRMCESYGANCDGCGLYDEDAMPACTSGKTPEECIAIVEQWAKEHPVKTRQSEFLKLLPGADVGETDGCLTLDPCNVYKKMRKECEGRKCSECRKAFWSAEVEDA